MTMNIQPKSRLDIIDTAQLAQREKRLLKYLLLAVFFVYLHQFGIPYITASLLAGIVPAEGATATRAKPGALPWRRLRDLAVALQQLRQREPIAERALAPWQAKLEALLPTPGQAPGRFAPTGTENDVRKLLPGMFRAVLALGHLEPARTQALRAQMVDLGKSLTVTLDESAPPLALDYGPRTVSVNAKPHRVLFDFGPSESKGQRQDEAPAPILVPTSTPAPTPAPTASETVTGGGSQ